MENSSKEPQESFILFSFVFPNMAAREREAIFFFHFIIFERGEQQQKLPAFKTVFVKGKKSNEIMNIIILTAGWNISGPEEKVYLLWFFLEGILREKWFSFWNIHLTSLCKRLFTRRSEGKRRLKLFVGFWFFLCNVKLFCAIFLGKHDFVVMTKNRAHFKGFSLRATKI